MPTRLPLTVILSISLLASTATADPNILDLWPAQPPGPQSQPTGPEADTAKPQDKLVGGKTVIEDDHLCTADERAPAAAARTAHRTLALRSTP